MPFFQKEVRLMEKSLRLRDRLVTAYWSVIGMLSAAVCTVHPVMADSIFDRIRSIVTDIYGQIVAISTIVAVTVASIALIVRMISRNQRAVDEATSWLKRIVVAWIILNSLGFVVAYLQPLVAGGQYTG
jgi:integral membrane sensor domain MASE1